MAQVQKQLIASQKFLVGLVSLPQYEELRLKQLQRLMAVTRKAKLTIEQAAGVLASLDLTLWDEASLSQLKSLVADQTICDEMEEDGSQRAKQQDFTAMVHYLDDAWWRRLETAQGKDREKNCELLCQHVGRLGLTNPTEETYAFLYVLSFALHPATVIFDCEKLNLLAKWKPITKRQLKMAVAPPLQLLVLPCDVEQCPAELLRAAYPQGFRAGIPCHMTIPEVTQLGRTWPLRKTHLAATASQKTSLSGVLESGQMMQAMAAATVQAVASQFGALQRAESVPELPGFKILKPPCEASSVAKPKEQLALMDAPQDGTKQSGGSVSRDAASIISALQSDLQEENKAAPEKFKRTPKAKSEKKPKKKAVLKESGKKNGSEQLFSPAKPSKACMKRPASKGKSKVPAVVGSKKRPSETAEEKEAKRRLLFKRVPKTLQKKYAHGCSKCRGRPGCTLSCWFERGYTI
eukprot:s339_g10.t1